MSILTSPSNLRSSPPEWPDLARFTARDKVPCHKSAVCQRGAVCQERGRVPARGRVSARGCVLARSRVYRQGPCAKSGGAEKGSVLAGTGGAALTRAWACWRAQ